jgi:hypothetical protein
MCLFVANCFGSEGNLYLLCKYEMNTFRARTSRAHCPLQTQNKQLYRAYLKKEVKNYKRKDIEEKRGMK